MENKLKLPGDFSAIHLAVVVLICIVAGGVISFLLLSNPLQAQNAKTELSSEQGSVPSNEQVAVAAEKYINENLIDQKGMTVKASGVKKNGDSLYEVSFGLYLNGKTVNQGSVYVTSDLKNLVILGQAGAVLDLSEPLPEEEEEAPVEAEGIDLPKTEKPKVELFVMSHCPYGTQIEKGLLPVIETLGGKAEFEVKFVYYAMHGKTEIDEELLQVCIKKEKPEQYWNYLACFLREGKSNECLADINSSLEDLNSCIAETDAEFNVTANFNDHSKWLNGRNPLFDVYNEDNEKYGIEGSPTLVVNGTKVSGAKRDSAGLLSIICSAFSSAPEECNASLSPETPSTGFGYEGTGADAAATCG